MTHRKSIAAIDSTATVQEAFDFIMNESYSRYPVIDGDIDNIMGILHIRDLFKSICRRTKNAVNSCQKSKTRCFLMRITYLKQEISVCCLKKCNLKRYI